MGQIALSNVINISLSALPQGLTKYKTNNIALFSNETSSSVDPYIAAVSAADVEAAYGTNSLTAKMARAIFTPAYNLRTGEGTLFVFPYSAVNAVAESQTTVAITATKITALKLISSGDLTIGIDGTDYALTGLDFTKISTVADVVKVIANSNIDCNIEVTEPAKAPSDQFFWGTWIDMSTGKEYEIEEEKVKINSNSYSILAGSNEKTLKVDGLGTFEKQSDSVIIKDETIPYFRKGGTDLW